MKLLLSLSLVTLCYGAKKDQTALLLKNPLSIENPQDKGKASLGDLLKEHQDLKDIQVLGKVVIGHDQTIKIMWEEVSLEKEKKVKKRKLPKQLKSHFRTKAQEIKEGTKVNAKGDIDTLIREARLLLQDSDPSKQKNRGEGQNPHQSAHQSSSSGSQNQNASSNPASRSGNDSSKDSLSPHNRHYGSSFQSSDINGSGVNGQDSLTPHHSQKSGRNESASSQIGNDSFSQIPHNAHRASINGSDINDSKGSPSDLSHKNGRKGINGSDPFSQNPHRSANGSGENDSEGVSDDISKTKLKNNPFKELSEEELFSSRNNPFGTKDGKDLSSHKTLEEEITLEGASKGSLMENPSHLKSGSLSSQLLPQNPLHLSLQKTSVDSDSLESAEDPITIEITQEGCVPRVDLAQGAVIPQNRALKKKKGEVIEYGECKDTFTRYPILKSYTCEDLVEGEFAYPQYKTYWRDESFLEHPLEGCQPNREKAFPLVESPCDPILQNDQVVFTAEQVYMNRNNKRVQVKDCRPTGKTLPLQWENCGITHHEGFSLVKQQAFYLEKDKRKLMGACQERGDALTHKRVPCGTLVEEGFSIPQFKTEVSTPEGVQTVSACAPDPTFQEELQQETCPDTFIHEKGKSFEAVKVFHTLEGFKSYVTDCVKGKRSFPHLTEIDRYVHDPKAKKSQAFESLYIETPQGKKQVDGPKIRRSPIPWVLKEKKLEIIPEKAFFEECHKITPSRQVEIFERPDGVLITQIIGEGPLQKGADGCVRTLETKQKYDRTWASIFSQGNDKITRLYEGVTKNCGYDNYLLEHSCCAKEMRFGLISQPKLNQIFYHFQRTKTVFPENHKKPFFTNWEKTGESTVVLVP